MLGNKDILTSRHLILAFISAVFVFLFSATTSPLYIGHHCWFYGDAGIFQEMGLLILNGGVPYLDLFDHKGPILFFIQALGLGINENWGLSIIQIISLFFTLLIFFRIACLFSNKKWLNFILIVLTLCFLMLYYQRGDLCEEWCLPFICLPLYYCLATMNGTRGITTKDYFIIGFCVGIIAFIRINNVAPIIPFVLYVLIKCLVEKKTKEFWQNIILIVLGFVLVAFICCLIFFCYARWNGIYEMIYATFIFNFSYFSNSCSEFTQYETICFYIPILFFFISTICVINNNNKAISVFLMLSYLITILAMGKNCYSHYRIIVLPLYLVTLSIMFTQNKWISSFAVGFLLAFSLYCDYSGIDNLVSRLQGTVLSYRESDFHRFISKLPEEEKNSIYNEYAFPVHFFVDEKLVQCNRFVLPGHVQKSSRLLKQERKSDISTLEPAWILLPKNSHFAEDKLNVFLTTNYYLADSIQKSNCELVYCYKRQEDIKEE